MGNCPACLSMSKPPQFGIGVPVTQVDDDLLTTTAATSTKLACDLLVAPVLKPCILLPSHNQLKGKLHHLEGETQKLAPTSPAADHKTADNHPKPIKKVRFAEDVMLISNSDPRRHPLVNEGNTFEELAHKNKPQSGMPGSPTSILIDQKSNMGVKQSSIVRVKVVISKKELNALLQTKGKQSSSTDDALMLESICITPPALHAKVLYNVPCSTVWQPYSSKTSVEAHTKGSYICPSIGSAA